MFEEDGEEGPGGDAFLNRGEDWSVVGGGDTAFGVLGHMNSSLGLTWTMACSLSPSKHVVSQ